MYFGKRCFSPIFEPLVVSKRRIFKALSHFTEAKIAGGGLKMASFSLFV